MARRMKNVVEVDDFAVAVSEVIEKYYGTVADKTNLLIAETAVETAQELQRTSPKRVKGKRAGEYARSWYIRQNKKRKDSCELEIANHDYQLTHLLEKGHIKVVHGHVLGFTDAIPHIRPAEIKAKDKILGGLIKIIGSTD